jgi:hypothetical protein
MLSDPVVHHWLDKHEDERDDYSQERLDRLFLRALAKTPPLWAGRSATDLDSVGVWKSLTDVEACLDRLDQISKKTQ